MRYRPEIDGLRAVAVIPVILFHARFAAFSGGFVGVDVFFVISGYLITSIVLADLNRGAFRLVHFYERRARRVLPALFLVLIVVTPFAWAILTPRAMREFASSLVAVATFSSNFYFLRQSGYFDIAADLKPLLHTWSLAVEEQYYILFPLLLMISWRHGKRWLTRLLAVLFVASLGCGLWVARDHPAAAFYLLPTRAWEILIGAFAALHLAQAAGPRSARHRHELLGAAGLACIVFAVCTFDATTPYPSLYTLIPTVGALLVILYAQGGTIVQRFLSARVAVGIGLVSYSAYLWHQPIFALVTYRAPTAPSPLVMGALSLATLPLATLSWRFVETPFRRREVVGRSMVFTLAAAASAVIIAIGIWGKERSRQPTSVTVGGARIAIPVAYAGLVRDGHACSFPAFDPPTVCRIAGTRPPPERVLVVIGDSHARVLTEAMAERPDLYGTFIDLSASGCPFLLGMPVFVGMDAHKCTAEYQRQRLAYLRGIRSADLVIVMAARWPLYLDGRGFDNTVGGVEPTRDILATDDPAKPQSVRTTEFFRALDATIAEASALAKTVVFVLPNAANGWDPVERALQVAGAVPTTEALFGALQIPMAAVTAWVRPVDAFVAQEAGRYPNLVVVDPLPLTCNPGGGVCDAGREGRFLFADRDHLTLPINRVLVDEIASAISSSAAR